MQDENSEMVLAADEVEMFKNAESNEKNCRSTKNIERGIKLKSLKKLIDFQRKFGKTNKEN